jgi:hypothetical protein
MRSGFAQATSGRMLTAVDLDTILFAAASSVGESNHSGHEQILSPNPRQAKNGNSPTSRWIEGDEAPEHCILHPTHTQSGCQSISGHESGPARVITTGEEWYSWAK